MTLVKVVWGDRGQISRVIYAHTGLPLGCYLDRQVMKKIIKRLLHCDRMERVPTRVSGYTEARSALLLNITVEQLRMLQTSLEFYNRVIRFINFLLVDLYCRTKFCNNWKPDLHEWVRPG